MRYFGAHTSLCRFDKKEIKSDLPQVKTCKPQLKKCFNLALSLQKRSIFLNDIQL